MNNDKHAGDEQNPSDASQSAEEPVGDGRQEVGAEHCLKRTDYGELGF